ncbi:MAG: NAD(P)H dehydrogenase assembly family protein [Cyanobium sp.]|nr:NAD(P)H dehydrogenase assembly family protein [Cyanobium sp.]
MPASATPTSDDRLPSCWSIGLAVRLKWRPTYLKTADPMPMLRPPDLIGVDEVGQVVEERALGQLAVRFRRGTFLIAAEACEPVTDASA